MLFPGQSLIVRVLMGLIELVMHTAMLLINLVVLRAMAAGWMRTGRPCECCKRNGTGSGSGSGSGSGYQERFHGKILTFKKICYENNSAW